MDEKEQMRNYAEAHGCGYRDIPIRDLPGGGMICKRVYEPVRPLPCIRDERGHIDMQEVKSLILKIHEELIELEEAIVGYTGASINLNGYAGNEARAISDADRERIAEEAADLKTAVTTLENVLYIQESMRDEAQRRVNEKNRSRGRL